MSEKHEAIAKVHEILKALKSVEFDGTDNQDTFNLARIVLLDCGPRFGIDHKTAGEIIQWWHKIPGDYSNKITAFSVVSFANYVMTSETWQRGLGVQPLCSEIRKMLDAEIETAEIVTELEPRTMYHLMHNGPSAHISTIGPNSITDEVMTSSEIEETYNLSQSTVAQAIRRGQIPARKSGGVWLIARKDADERWNRRKS